MGPACDSTNQVQKADAPPKQGHCVGRNEEFGQKCAEK